MSILERLAKRDQQTGGIGRHTVLLVSLLLLLVMLPVLRYLPGGEGRFSLLMLLVVGAAVYANSTERWTLILGALMGGGAIVAGGVARAAESTTAQIVSDALGLSVLSFTTLFVLNTVMHTQKVTRDTVVGGICVYLLIGLCYAMSYLLITDISPGTLIDRGQGLVRSDADGGSLGSAIIYFSYVTLTTLGYGDITPTGEIPRMLVASEAIIGQLYVAIFIARLIAMRHS